MFAMLLSLALVASAPMVLTAGPADPFSPEADIAAQMADNHARVTADLARARMLDIEVSIAERLMAMGESMPQPEEHNGD